MYSVTVRDSVMIAHSLPNPNFGPAQNLHGATFVVDAEFLGNELNADNVVIDIVAARNALRAALDLIAYQNLDDLDQFRNQLTTAEHIARFLHDALRAEIAGMFDGHLRIRMRETHDAWVSYEDSAPESEE